MDESTEHYRTVTYWYGLPRPSLVQTDPLKVGDEASEKRSRVRLAAASPPYSITSRYESGGHAHGRYLAGQNDRAARRRARRSFVSVFDPAN